MDLCLAGRVTARKCNGWQVNPSEDERKEDYFIREQDASPSALREAAAASPPGAARGMRDASEAAAGFPTESPERDRPATLVILPRDRAARRR
jgi:hypothetical protein